MTRVLVIEDDPAAAELLAVVMQRAGYTVAVVGTAAEALQTLPHGPHVVLLDLGLPDMDGLELCRAVRATRPALPIIAVTARSSEPDLVLALDAGADDYLLKPFRTQELLARVRAALRRSSTSDLRFIGDLAIDTTTLTAAAHGTALPLTPKEFEILMLLARSNGQTVERERLMHTLWTTPLPSNSKSLDMHLSALRRKLLKAGSTVTIRNVRGVGYVLGT